jgi:ubiquinone/menaquinone biosynthesis C-methylase UbiE
MNHTSSNAIPPIVHLPADAGYDLWAEIYDAEDNPLIKMEEPRFDALLGPVAGLEVLDVGCGTGRLSLRLAAQGARVTAIDFSDGMLNKAHAKNDRGSITFQKHDLTQPLPFDEARFDRLVCALVLEHISDLPAVVSEFRRVLRPGGFAVISNMHPAMMLRGISARFTNPATGLETRPRSHDHKVCDYVMAALSAGFKIDHLSEHAVDAAAVARSPRAEKYLGWPMLLMMRLGR